ncbi:glycogen debranching protein GlgX [Demequina sp. SYSU T00039]|uniref:Glycogen debranching protein GlgX n=1 Tax=Demequina lignilytica TaxID=3051663 RepID=A0AAW7M5F1_9MICO|nr:MULTISPECIES: glycogen debranching protein GlgX [unclassified Demequina]MDN4478777.1 glycogen debranching protein GlgX [Demequina sp. SYSU T00039-1]MDN4488875.1 glycogen debranching protein GlgX [Demequina sp. SYSU T00039]
MTSPTVAPSPNPHRLGVHLVEGGADVAVFAAHATAVHLCLFEGDDRTETRIALHGPVNGIWHAFVPGIRAGQRYGFRASGPWQPKQGHRYNPAKLLLDPYGRGIEGRMAAMTEMGSKALLSSRDATDSAPLMPRSVVTEKPSGPWQTPHPRVPWTDTVIYETHVKGFTKLMPGVPEELRGTYAGLAHPAAIEYLQGLGVTAVELLPIHAFAPEPHLEHGGLSSYWGYSTLGFFAPHAPYATEAARAAGAQAVQDEFCGMVDLLHQAGLEVILDVVYNHTCEGSSSDRVLSWKGLDNHLYYRSQPHAPQHYDDTTGTGNTLDFGVSIVTKMALDSLRYWATEMRVDGFRFDLAATLGRTGQGFSSNHPFLVGLTTDPVLGSLKLIAEPWDIGLGGWQVGNFPQPMTEWNDRFRDYARSFWLQQGAAHAGQRHHPSAPELATRIAGSSDLFGHSAPYGMRGPIASINFVTAHDGFTAHDLTAYNGKHNEANGEDNRDGTDNNRSFNHGVEGATDDEAILHARRRSLRNLLGTLLISAGTPMLLGGDEFGRSQGGNNNAYCQDNEISWFDWEHDDWQVRLRESIAELIRLRREHAVLKPGRFYDGVDRDPTDALFRADSAWFRADGEHEDEDWWESPETRVVQFMRSLSRPEEADALVIINGDDEEVDVTIPSDQGAPWHLAWDSAWDALDERDGAEVAPGATQTLEALSLRLYLTRP